LIVTISGLSSSKAYNDRFSEVLPLFLKKRIRPIVGIAGFIVISNLFAGTGSRLFQAPSSTLFFEFFIKDVLLFLLIFCVMWFVLLLKATPHKIDEIIFLYSLPFTPKQIAGHIIVSHLWKGIWIPISISLLTAALIPYAPIPHICRMIFFIFITYAFTVLLNLVLHFIFNVVNSPLYRFSPFIAFPTILIFILLVFLGALADEWLTGYSFWVIAGVTPAVCTGLLLLFHRLFSIWLRHNGLYAYEYKGTTAHQGSRKSLLYPWRLIVSPFLYKNFLRIEREKSVSHLALTLLFIIIGYLLSRNNQRLEDFIAILMTVSIIYAFIFVLRTLISISPENEPIEICYALPLTNTTVYSAFFYPAAFWLVLVVTIFTGLAAVSAVPATVVAAFWLKSIGFALGLLCLGINISILTYPNASASLRYFFVCILLYLILSALFYKYRYFLFFGLVAITFAGLIRRRFYLTYKNVLRL